MIRKVIWISSYPKSGNNWLHSVIRTAGKAYGFPPGELDIYVLLKEKRPLLACNCVAPMVADNPCGVFKTHACFDQSRTPHAKLGLAMAGFIHVYRNPLDVLLSYLNYTRLEYARKPSNRGYRKRLFMGLLGMPAPVPYAAWKSIQLEDIPRKNLDHALGVFGEADTRLEMFNGMSGSWIENTASWIGACGPHRGIVLRYEDLLDDNREFLKVVPYFTFGADDVTAALQRVNDWVKEVKAGPASTDRAIFHNKMRSYYFPEFFSRGAIDRFFSRHETVLKQRGYGHLLARA